MYNQVVKQAKSKANLEDVWTVFSGLVEDTKYMPMVRDWFDQGFPETRAFVNVLSKIFKPKTFLEIGVRRGWSTCCVAKNSPDVEIYAFDEWHEGYGGAPNPGPDFVQSELATVGYTKPVNFISGDSHVTVRKFFKDNPDIIIDLALIDGDHSVDGAIQDIDDVMPYMSDSGVMIFDDTVDCAGLQSVWDRSANKYTDFDFYSFNDNKPGVGFAIHK